MRNRVKRELRLGEYYEKPSERKKRLAVERHRRRFQDLVSRLGGGVRKRRRVAKDEFCVSGSTKSSACTDDQESIVMKWWIASRRLDSTCGEGNG